MSTELELTTNQRDKLRGNEMEKIDLIKLVRHFGNGPVKINEQPLRTVGGKQNSPHLKTTAYHMNWLYCDWINTESSFEADFVLVTAMNPKVSAIFHQRARVTLPDGSIYTPDFLVIENGEPKIVEVKPYKFTLKPFWVEKFAKVKEVCNSARISFEVATELDFRIKKLHKRAEYIAYCAGLKFKEEHIKLAASFISKHPNGITLGEFTQKTGLTKLIILHLVALRTLSLNTNLEYEESSLVYISQGC
jgi:hypothetical protein